jgi:hypothetical protein
VKREAVLFRLARPAILGAVAVLSCTNQACGCDPVPLNPLAGVWAATQFLVTPTGQSQLDVLAAGGSLTITIFPDNATSGSLSVPASVTGGAPIMASMAGVSSLNSAETEVTFDQAADTFVRDLTWQRASASSLTVTNQVAGSAAFSITLSRQ